MSSFKAIKFDCRTNSCNLHYEQFSDGTVKCVEDEVPFDVPNGWIWSRFATVFIINPRNYLSDDAVVSFVPMPLIQEGYSNKHTYDEKLWGKVKSGFTHFANNDVGVAKITPCFENKKSVIFKDLKNGYGAGTTELHIIRTIGNMIFPEYVLWNIKTDNFIANGKKAFSGAVGQKRIGRDFVENSLIPIPPTNEQKRIIECISSTFMYIDDIDNSKQEFKLDIQVIKNKILDLAIRGKLAPQNPDDEPASALLERIRAEKEELIKQGKIKRDKKESVIFKGEDNSYYIRAGEQVEDISAWELDDLPDNWAICALGEICDYGSCINVETGQISDNEWILDLEDIEKDSGKVLCKIRKLERTAISTKHKFTKGQVLYSKLRPYLNKVVLADEDGYCTSEILPLIFMDIIIPAYARYYLMSPTFLKYADRCSYGVKMPRLSTTDGKKAVFTVPPINEQFRIVEAIKNSFAQLDEILNSIS